ncbi:PLP-dependent aminotransferase family protein [Ramlibacter ginsenosidimutans]|uniref:PLP-dependent aminotransferase family protein n=1 Tax=Ramlibacter ginsenosidimutans TaxID=502333 RepID=A0A934TTI4_9BURK|nr:PLP-dependent aminotransferase family protein [Ramlibacter ginsenosidimutans]MBK6007108.1 PLP-dependent aminotransferase family protein [Ramlibacter ginsenosidimutans]
MPRSRYKELVDRFATDIRSGRLRPGTQLPTHRQLAAAEGLALVTASRVYAELGAMGLTSGETGRGTFVKETALPRGQGIDQFAVAADVVDLNFNYPSVAGQGDLLRQALRQLAASGDVDSFLRYQPHGGRPQDRNIVGRHLRTRGVAVPADRVLLVDGAQHGLAVTAMALLKPGDVVAVDALTYPGFKVLADGFRLELLPLPAAGDGPDLNVLETLCKRRPVRAVYTMPTLHNPLGWVMSANRRRNLVSIARKHDLVLIEDAAYAFLAADAPAPLAALAPERTIYVSGVSKSIATGLRVGFLAAPGEVVPKLERAIRATTWNSPALMTALACRWLEDGTAARLEAEKRKDAARRQALATKLLQPLRTVGHPSSYFCWLPLTEGARADRVATALMQEHVSVSTAEPYCTTPSAPHALRLALGSVELDTLARALSRVRKISMDHMAVA